MPKQTRRQRNKANRTTHDIPEDLNKLDVRELRDLCKNLGIKQDGGQQALTNQLEQARENHVQGQNVDVTAAMISHQPSGTGSVFSDSQRKEVFDLMKTAISDAAEAAASRAINFFQELRAQQSNSIISCETETTHQANMASREGPNELIQQQQQQQPQ